MSKTQNSYYFYILIVYLKHLIDFHCVHRKHQLADAYDLTNLVKRCWNSVLMNYGFNITFFYSGKNTVLLLNKLEICC